MYDSDKCPECKGKGRIELFTSVAVCEACQGIGGVPVIYMYRVGDVHDWDFTDNGSGYTPIKRISKHDARYKDMISDPSTTIPYGVLHVYRTV